MSEKISLDSSECIYQGKAAILRDEQPFYFHMILNFVCMKKSENLLA